MLLNPITTEYQDAQKVKRASKYMQKYNRAKEWSRLHKEFDKDMGEESSFIDFMVSMYELELDFDKRGL